MKEMCESVHGKEDYTTRYLATERVDGGGADICMFESYVSTNPSIPPTARFYVPQLLTCDVGDQVQGQGQRGQAHQGRAFQEVLRRRAGRGSGCRTALHRHDQELRGLRFGSQVGVDGIDHRSEGRGVANIRC